MAILHMQTDRVRQSARQMRRTADQVGEAANHLQRSLSRLHNDWYGASANRFANDMRYILRTLQHVTDEGQQLSRRVEAEVDEWQNVDNSRTSMIPPPNRHVFGLPAVGAEIGAIGAVGGGFGGGGSGSWGDSWQKPLFLNWHKGDKC